MIRSAQQIESLVPGELAARVVDQRLHLHNVSQQEYEAIIAALGHRPLLQMNYNGENLVISASTSDSAAGLWTSDTQRLLLHDIAWNDYETLLHALDEHHLRTTYDHGSMELMTLSPEHEGYKGRFHLFIHVLCEEFNAPKISLGMMTCRREDMERGLEPDDCYYLKNWEKVRGKKRLDFSVDPPPDMALEIEITRSALDRMAIYAALRVPEVWRFDGKVLRVFLLNAAGDYEQSNHSPTFPGISLEELAKFAMQTFDQDETSAVRAFRAWVRTQLANKPQG